MWVRGYKPLLHGGQLSSQTMYLCLVSLALAPVLLCLLLQSVGGRGEGVWSEDSKGSLETSFLQSPTALS